MGAKHDAYDLEAQARALQARILALDAAPGASRLLSRVESELKGITSGASDSRLLGAANNLAAVAWELEVWAWAPEPVALAKTIRAPKCTAVTIDAVAAGGSWWLEAKASLPFGLGSTAWQDLQEQLSRLMPNARACFSGVERPQVLVVFRHACPEEMVDKLRDLGVLAVSTLPRARARALARTPALAQTLTPTMTVTVIVTLTLTLPQVWWPSRRILTAGCPSHPLWPPSCRHITRPCLRCCSLRYCSLCSCSLRARCSST